MTTCDTVGGGRGQGSEVVAEVADWAVDVLARTDEVDCVACVTPKDEVAVIRVARMVVVIAIEVVDVAT